MTASVERNRSHGCGWYAAGPLLAAAVTVLGALLVARRWADCPRGMDVPTRASMALSLPVGWIGMTVLLVLLQAVLVAVLPEGIEPEVKWVVLVVAAVLLFLLYVFGMGSPDTGPGGSCYRG
ncbi:hypothetical protein GCM10010519_26270 [Streptomyces lactacystinicus]